MGIHGLVTSDKRKIPLVLVFTETKVIILTEEITFFGFDIEGDHQLL